MANILILGGGFAGVVAAERLARALDPAEHQITLVSRSRRFTFYPALERLHVETLNDFPVAEVEAGLVRARDGREVEYDLLMLVPPFEGTSALAGTGLTDESGFVRVDQTMRVLGAERMYAAGDAVYFSGPKMGHMAVNQAAVAAENLAAELAGRGPTARYEHEMLLVVDAGGRDSVFLRKRLWEEGDRKVSWGLFWGWAKRAHERYWQAKHS